MFLVQSVDETEKVSKQFRFPLGTIKKIIKLDDEVNMASQVNNQNFYFLPKPVVKKTNPDPDPT